MNVSPGFYELLLAALLIAGTAMVIAWMGSRRAIYAWYLSLLVCLSSLLGSVFLFQRQGIDTGLRGWVGPQRLPESFRVGWWIDSLGATVVGAFAGALVLLLIPRVFLLRVKNPHRLFASLLISLVCVGIAWFGSTPWTALIATGMGSIVVSLGAARSDDESEEAALSSMSLLKTTLTGVLISSVGLVLLNVMGIRIFWDAWSPLPFEGWGGLGTALFLGGCLIVFKGFPFFSTASLGIHGHLTTQFFLVSTFPCVCVSAILMRMFFKGESSLGIDLSALLSGEQLLCTLILLFCLGSALLTSLIAFFQIQWKRVLAMSYSALWMFFAFLLILGQAASAFGLLIFLILTPVTVGNWVLLFDPATTGPRSQPKKPTGLAWVMGISMIAFLCPLPINLMGLSLSPLGMDRLAQSPIGLGMTVFFSLWALLVSRLVFGLLWSSLGIVLEGWTVFSVLTSLISVLTWWWTGTLTGSDLFSGSDRISQSLLARLFAEWSELQTQQAPWFVFSFLGFFIAIGLGYLLNSQWDAIQERLGRFAQIIREGFYLQQGAQAISQRWVRWSYRGERWITFYFWNEWAPFRIHHTLAFTSGLLRSATLPLQSAVTSGSKKMVTKASRVLQWIQNGNTQFYLAFSIGVATLLLLHFLWSHLFL